MNRDGCRWLYSLRARSPDRATGRWLGAIIAVWAIVYLRRLTTALAVWDESIYAASARLLLRNGAVLTPHVQGGLGGVGPHLFLEKPPLAIWIQAVSIALLGPTEIAARLPSVLFVLGTAVLVFVLGRGVVSRRTGGFAAMVFLATPHLFEGMNGGRDGATDPALVFFGTLALAMLWFGLSEEREGYVVAAGAAGGLAALTKGIAVGTFALAAIGLLVSFRRRVSFRAVLAGGGLAVLVGGWWPLLMWSRYGDAFVTSFLLDQVVSRASESSVAFGTAYFTTLPWSFGPWLYLLCPLAIAIGMAVRRSDDLQVRVFAGWLACWAILVFGLFAVVGNHLWYVLPAYVPLSLLVGWGLALAVDGDRLARLGVAVGTLATLALSYRTQVVHYPVLVLGGGLLVVLAPTVAKYAARLDERYPATLRVVATCWLVLFAVGLTAPMYEFGGAYGQRTVGQAVDAQVPEDATIHVGQHVGSGLYPLSFYAGRPFTAANMSTLETDDRVRYALVTNGTEAQLQRAHTTVRGASTARGNWSVVAFRSSAVDTVQ